MAETPPSYTSIDGTKPGHPGPASHMLGQAYPGPPPPAGPVEPLPGYTPYAGSGYNPHLAGSSGNGPAPAVTYRPAQAHQGPPHPPPPQGRGRGRGWRRGQRGGVARVRNKRPVCGYLVGWIAGWLVCALPCMIVFGIFAGNYGNVNMGMFIWMPIVVLVMGTCSLCVFRRRSHGVLTPGCVSLGLFLFFLVQTAIFVGIDFSQKCDNFANLDQRSTRMLYGPACPYGVFIYFALAGLFFFVIVGSCILGCGCSHARSQARMSAYHALNSGQGGVYGPPRAMYPQVKKTGIIGWIVNGILVVALVATFFAVFYALTFTTHPARRVDQDGNVADEHGFPGSTTCPVGDIFYDAPRTADLQCCSWHNKATCVNVNKLFAANENTPTCQTPGSLGGLSVNGTALPSCQVCNAKPDVSLYFRDLPGCSSDSSKCSYLNSDCDSLNGLYTCAMMGGKAANYLDYGDAVNPISQLRMCSSFCQEWYNTCQPYAVNTYESAQAFCQAIGTNVDVVEDDGLTCFSPAASLPRLSLLPLLALAFIIFLLQQ